MELTSAIRKNIVFKSNELTTMSYDLTTQQQKIMLLLTSLVKRDDNKFNEYALDLKRLAILLDIDSSNLYRTIPKITKSLIEKGLQYKVEVTNSRGKIKKGLVQTGFLSSAKYIQGEGVVTVEISKALSKYLFELKDNFTAYTLENVLNLKSKYAIRFYERFKMEEYKGKFVWSIAEIKEQLKLTQKSYEEYRNLKAKVLEQALKEINAFTDIKATYEPIKEGRKIVAFQFRLTAQDVKAPKTTGIKKKAVVNTNTKVVKDIKKELDFPNEVEKCYSELRAKYPAEFIEAFITEAQEKARAGKVKHLIKWLEKVAPLRYEEYKIELSQEQQSKKAPKSSNKRRTPNTPDERESHIDALLKGCAPAEKESTTTPYTYKKKDKKKAHLDFPQREYTSEFYDKLENSSPVNQGEESTAETKPTERISVNMDDDDLENMLLGWDN